MWKCSLGKAVQRDNQIVNWSWIPIVTDLYIKGRYFASLFSIELYDALNITDSKKQKNKKYIPPILC